MAEFKVSFDTPYQNVSGTWVTDMAVMNVETDEFVIEEAVAVEGHMTMDDAYDAVIARLGEEDGARVIRDDAAGLFVALPTMDN